MPCPLKHHDLDGVPIAIFANKQDVSSARSADEISGHLGLDRGISRPYRLQAISALTCEGIEDGVNWLVETVENSSRVKSKQHR
jgi:signal recognition particle receptor subunit beta